MTTDEQIARLQQWLEARDVTADLSLAAQEAEHQRRLAEARAHSDEPAYRDAARAADPHANDPAWHDVPEWLMVRRDFKEEW